jgi:4-hydroxybenzoate polyprenyltransferase
MIKTWIYLKSWFDLIRVFNVPIPLAGMLVGSYAADPTLGSKYSLILCICAVLGCAATQSYNDYGDREVDAQNADFRPIPSQRLSAREVLIGGHLITTLWVLISLIYSPVAAIIVVIVYGLTRFYSCAKKITLFHHLMLPMALGLMPLYGSLMSTNTLCPIAIIAGISIFLIDINMNIVGAFKDLWDGSANERVLPLVWGSRPAVAVAIVTGICGIFVQVGAIAWGLCRVAPLAPLMLGLVLTVSSRVRLYRKPCAELGYAALKSGRLTECLTFPALLAGMLPPTMALLIITGLTVFALFTQTLIAEAKLPDLASVQNEFIKKG